MNYEGVSVGVHDSQVRFGAVVWYSNDIWYSYMLNNCEHCFGCAELNAKKYCIFNKQYTKEEYEKIVPQIIEQMKKVPYVDKKGRVYIFGEYFPSELSPFTYNETIAQDYFPLTPETAEQQGYTWREYVPNLYITTIKGKDLPDSIEDVDQSILNEVIECEITKKPFKIIEDELSFYKRLNLPIPSIHPEERHNRRLKLRNEMRFYKRKCYVCGKIVDTTYRPVEEGGPEKVLCTEDYNKEIY